MLHKATLHIREKYSAVTNCRVTLIVQSIGAFLVSLVCRLVIDTSILRFTATEHKNLCCIGTILDGTEDLACWLHMHIVGRLEVDHCIT